MKEEGDEGGGRTDGVGVMLCCVCVCVCVCVCQHTGDAEWLPLCPSVGG